MKSRLIVFCSLLLCLLLLTACGLDALINLANPQDNESETTQQDDEDNQQEQDTAGREEEQAEPDPTDDEAESNEDDAIALGDFNVFLAGEMVEADDTIIINGESNLLPGARVVGEVSAGDEDFFADTTELVQEDGSFYIEVAHHNLDMETTVEVKFHFDVPQDDAIIRHYGDRGQNLEGPYVYQHQRKRGGRSPSDIFQQAKVTASFDPGEERAVRQFQEPEWYDLPDDYGDPRVWIEVDEINDDQEFYYLHGRSNILEGAEIRGSFGPNRDRTRILPDGSFNLKIPYEYRESEQFVIEFRPDDFQWNIIEETYGKEGQKLVGNLVVTNQYNNKQRIEKEIELQSTEIHVPDNVELTIDGSDMTMLVPDHLLFDFDEYELKAEAKKILAEIGETLELFDKGVEVQINGHTDNVGNEQYNMDLSEKRAQEVKDYLLDQGDFQNINFVTKGYGESKPVASNDDEKGQAKNRRVEIVIKLR